MVLAFHITKTESSLSRYLIPRLPILKLYDLEKTDRPYFIYIFIPIFIIFYRHPSTIYITNFIISWYFCTTYPSSSTDHPVCLTRNGILINIRRSVTNGNRVFLYIFRQRPLLLRSLTNWTHNTSTVVMCCFVTFELSGSWTKEVLC